MTVSRVLRGESGVSEAMRRKVVRAARILGYQWNPVASQLMRAMRRGRVTGFREKIAWLNPSATPDAWKKRTWYAPYYLGALQRAQSSGLIMENIWLNDPSLTPGRIHDILVARGVHGVIIPRSHPKLFGFETAPFAVVFLQMADPPLPCHVVRAGYAENLRMAFRELRARGYRQIGLALHVEHETMTRGEWRSAYLLETQQQDDRQPVPMLRLPPVAEALRGRAFMAWMHTHRPEAVLCCDEFALRWVRDAQLRVPADLGLVHLSLHQGLTDWAGVDAGPARIAAAAVDLLFGQIVRGERGLPCCQQELLIKGRWVDGKTIRPA